MAQGTGKKQDYSPVNLTGMTRVALAVEEPPKEIAPAELVAPTEQAKAARPPIATAAIGLMLAAGGVDLALGIYWILWGANAFAGFLFLLIGGAYAYGGRGLYADESWGWGAGVLGGVLAVLVGVLVLPLGAIPIGVAIAVIVPLVLVRDHYGMVRFNPDVEERRNEEVRAQRTQNPGGVHCPRCGSTQLWIAKDGSAFCENCKAGILSIAALA